MARTVLLIDDDEDDAQFFSDAIKELALDMTMDYCSGGQQALDKLTYNRIHIPDIIFLDLNMPALNGWDCLREIKKIAGMQHIPIVMYSTANLYQEGVNPEDVGAAAFYQKSNSFSELKISLAALLRSVFPY
jgi:CheY-like chemotaxis protein